MTRMRTRFHTRQPMTLSVFRTNPFYSVLRAFGMQDVSVPNPALDRAYIVRTDHLSATQSLLMDRTLTRALLALRKGRLEVVRERRRLRLTDGSELRWVTSGKLEADEDLENVLALVRSTIDGLLRLGIARVPMSVDDWG